MCGSEGSDYVEKSGAGEQSARDAIFPRLVKRLQEPAAILPGSLGLIAPEFREYGCPGTECNREICATNANFKQQCGLSCSRVERTVKRCLGKQSAWVRSKQVPSQPGCLIIFDQSISLRLIQPVKHSRLGSIFHLRKSGIIATSINGANQWNCDFKMLSDLSVAKAEVLQAALV